MLKRRQGNNIWDSEHRSSTMRNSSVGSSKMDVNRVLQNTRQYFQGIPSSSPTTGELAPGASVGYSSPPVSSSATSTATSATNPFPSYQQQNLSTQSLLWSSSSSPSPSASAPMQNVSVPVYLSTTIPSQSGYPQSGVSSAGSMTPVSSVTYPRTYPAGTSTVATPYRVYENSIDVSSNTKSMRAGPTNTFAQQTKYTAPSITRFKDGSSEGMYNMDSIVCQPNVNHPQSKNSKMKVSPVMTSSSSSLSSTSVYKPSIHVHNSRFYNHHMPLPQIPSLPQKAESIATCQIPSSVSSSQIFSPTTHQLHQQTVENQSISPQNYSACNSLAENRVGYQQQAGYQVARGTSVNKISQHDHADGLYYKYRLIENAAVGTTPPTVVMKRDSPLDLSVKTIRQSADSTAHDDIENAAVYSQHFINNAHPSLRVQGRHSHVPQLPYTSVGLPSGGNTFNGIQSREMRCSSASSVDKMTSGYTAVAQYAPKNGHVSENVSRLPTISDFRNEQVTMSITSEQKQKVHHGEVNAESMQYSHYHHAMNTKARVSLPGECSIENANHELSLKTNHLPPTTIHPKLSSGIDSFPRKRRPTPIESPSLLKTPRVSTEWRQRFDKELENRLKEYENKKAREEKEKLLASKEENKSSNATVVQQIDAVPEKILTCLGEVDEHLQSSNCSPVVKQEQLRQSSEHIQLQCSSKLPFMQYLEQQQKAQHKLPVQPIQLHHSSQQWYQQGPQRSLAQATCRNSQYKPSSFPDAHQTAFTKLYDNRSDTKNIQNISNSKSVNSEKQKPLPPFKALPLKIGFPSKSSLIHVIDEPMQDMCPKENDRETVLRDEEYISSAFSKEKIDDHQSTAALMASALTHPRIRTKAELKQVISVNKMEEKIMTTCNELPESDVHGVSKSSDSCQPDKEENEKQTDKSKQISTSESKLRITDDAPYSCNYRSVPVNSITETEKLIIAVSSARLSSKYVDVADRQHSPRKNKSEAGGSDMKGSSSETTVFEFKDSDSEPEICSTDLHSLNEMQKDRKTVTTPSEMPVIIDQQRENISDDYKWLQACDELIQQFSNGGRKTRSCRKKMGDVDVEIPDEKPVKKEKLNASDGKEEKLIIPTSKIKKEPIAEDKTEDQSRIVRTPLKDSRIKVDPDKEKSPALVPKLVMETRNEVRRTRDNERDLRVEDRRVKDIERERRIRKQSPETRGQRSNISTTRMRIQNLLEKHSSDTESNTDGDARDDDDDDDDDFEEILPKKIVVQPKSMKKINVQSAKAKIKVSLNKKKKKRKIKKKMKKKKKKTMKQKQKLVSKKLKKVDEKREKMRRMILKRIETRKSKLEAIKSLRKTKMGNSSSDDKQPIMTRKMAKRECQKDNKREEMAKKKSTMIVHFGKRKVTDKYKKGKIERTSEKIRMFKKTRTKCKRPETRNQAKFDKIKKTEKVMKKSDRDSKVEKETFDDVTRRMLRSRNVILVNEKHEYKINKREKSCSGDKSVGTKEKQKSVIKIKKESKEVREMKEKVKIKGEEKWKVKEKETEKIDKKLPVKVEPSWEEELFNYKYSLRMPVKLINIARPVNWPKNSGGASSLPDLDRKETDSDLLNGISKPRATKRKNRNEIKFSNTKEFKDSVKYLKEKFDQKIEEKNKSSDLHTLMMENRIKIIPKSSDGPELLPTPSLDSFRSKMNSVTSKKDQKLGKDTNWTDDEDNGNEIVEDSLIGYFRKETVDVFKEVFEKHKMPNQFKTVILESRTRTQTKELKHHATLKQVFGLDRPASAPPVSDSKDVLPPKENDTKDSSTMSMQLPSKDSTNDMLKPWHKSFAQIKFLMGEEGMDSDENNKDFDDSVNFIVHQVDSRDPSETELLDTVVMKKKNRTIRRKCRSSGFDYIRKKKKIKKEDDDYFSEEKEKKKVVASVRPTSESIEDIQNEIKSWVVNKGIGETVLHKAARLGYLDISSYCLEKLKCSPSPTDNAGYTPLHEACTRGHLKIAKMLLKYGADVSASARGGIRPLHEAVENGDIELVRLLLSYGADPLLSTYGGQTPLSLVKENHDNLKEFLLLYLADIQGTPSKPWHFNGVDDFDREINGYDPLENPPSPVHEERETLEFEMSEWPLPILYRFKDELDYWVLYSDLPVPVRDAIKKHQKQNFENEDPSAYVLRKVTRTQFDENIDCVLWFVNKHLSKSKFKSNMNTITMVKYNEKLLTSLNVQKISMTFS